MDKVVRTTLSLVVILVPFSVVALAQAVGNNANKDKSEEHHSRLAKLEFWRHHENHKNSGWNAQRTQAEPAQSKPAQAKALQAKPSPARPAGAKKDPKEEQHASKMSKVPTKKASAANKAKPQEKRQDRTTASLQQ